MTFPRDYTEQEMKVAEVLDTTGLRYETQAPFGKYTVVWISQNLAIPFWIVGHIHLSIHSFHDLYELLASVGMNIIVLIGFIIDYKDVTKQIKEKS